MAKTVRQQIVEAIDARMKTILVTGDYETDVGENVFEWRTEPLEEGDLPALTYKDETVETEESHFVAVTNRMTVNVMAMVADSTPLATIRKIIADIDKAIGEDLTWGNLALTTQRIGDSMGVTINERSYAGCIVSVVITYRHEAWDDYTAI